MKKLLIPKNQIFNKDWKAFHLEFGNNDSDLYYIRLCNRILKEIPAKCSIDILNDVENRKEFVCMLVAYFEDIVSETGIWKAFISEHYKLYGKYLPFYRTGEQDDYIPGMHNLQDIGFLLWHYLCCKQEDSLFHPYFSLSVFEILRVTLRIFDEEYETAPENEMLQNFFTLDENTPFVKQIEILQFLTIRAYPNKVIFDKFIDNTLKEFLETEDEDFVTSNFNPLMYEVTMSEVFNRHNHLLALRENEFLSNILGENHPLYHKLLSISEKHSGYFLYKGETETHIQLIHIATGTKLDVIKESLSYSGESFVANQTAAVVSIAKYNNDYWQIGLMSTFDYNPEELKDKIPPFEYTLFNSLEEEKEKLKKQEKDFLEINNKEYIAFFETKREAEIFLQKTDIPNDLDCLDEGEDATLFFNPNCGLEIYPDIVDVLTKKNKIENPFTLIELLTENTFSVSFINYILENDLVSRESLINEGFEFVWDDFDFLLRYFKVNFYFETPEIRISDSSKSLIKK